MFTPHPSYTLCPPLSSHRLRTLPPVLGSPLSAFVAQLSSVGRNKRYKLSVTQGEVIPALAQFADAKATRTSKRRRSSGNQDGDYNLQVRDQAEEMDRYNYSPRQVYIPKRDDEALDFGFEELVRKLGMSDTAIARALKVDYARWTDLFKAGRAAKALSATAVTDVIEGVLKTLSPFSRAPNPLLYSLT